MTGPPAIRLAHPQEAAELAAMSRDLIEHGLGWRWRPRRIAQAMADPATNVAVASMAGRRAGFGIMRYRDEEAHLLLFAVAPQCRRQGVGRSLLAWLEACARTAGIGIIRVEARMDNAPARAFYRRAGYRECQCVAGLYDAREDGVRLAKDLWCAEPDAGSA
jgi:[ribosomal protein S18]-alanine N-acetyltransferase